MAIIREHAGYEIIKSVIFEHDEIVIAAAKETEQYVTWRYDPYSDNYYRGHYFSTMENAMIDFYERVKCHAITHRGVWERRKIEKERKQNASNEA